MNDEWSDRLTAMRERLENDPIVASAGAERLFGEVLAAVDDWDGCFLDHLFERCTSPAARYALAAGIRGWPDFEAAEPLVLDEAEPGTEGLAHVVAGDLVVEGDMDLYDGEWVIVLGDLRAETVVVDATAQLIVAGTVYARSVAVEGDVLAGEVRAGE